MLNIFELSRVREIAESWLVCVSSFSRIAQSYFLTKKKFSLKPFQTILFTLLLQKIVEIASYKNLKVNKNIFLNKSEKHESLKK